MLEKCEHLVKSSKCWNVAQLRRFIAYDLMMTSHKLKRCGVLTNKNLESNLNFKSHIFYSLI